MLDTVRIVQPALQPGPARALAIAVVATFAAVISLAAALLLGSLDFGIAAVWDATFSSRSGVVWDVVWKLRAPRAFAAFACGGLLALAGALLQVLLRNPLADPYVLGISSGASLGALAAIALSLNALTVNTAAFSGALAAIVLLFALSYRAGGWNMYRVLLTGVVLSAGLAALISLTLLLSPQAQVKGMLYWLMGDLSHADSPLAAWVVLIAVLGVSSYLAVKLDLLALGDVKSRSLGLHVAALQAGVFVCAALATVAAVMLGGAIGFVGLMVPHAIRLMGVARHRALLPLAVLLGGAFLTAADTAARMLWAPQQLPVGVLTALLGVPVMLVLLGRVR
ncbi:MAG: FecCD family ABC transporter permease [Rhodospirillaceae bacterium]